jgi:dTDP-glucose 4,6-dehydratase
VTGGAGFVGSHLCERLIGEGYEVLCVDNFVTGNPRNVEAFADDRAFHLLERDVSDALEVAGPLEAVYHFASPASPVDFERVPIEILEVGARGTQNCLDLALDKGALFVLASTSEVYGDPLEHPQREDYRGNVNPVGVRGVYDEAKRYAEAITMAYHRRYGLGTRIARIFNSYGPRIRPDDGRVVPNFITHALAGEPLVVYGDGSQTRSIQYVDDLVEGVILLSRSDETRPVNLGNPAEYRVDELAALVVELTGGRSEISNGPLPEDDPKRRCPDISRARDSLGWEPKVGAREGLAKTIEWFSSTDGALITDRH